MEGLWIMLFNPFVTVPVIFLLYLIFEEIIEFLKNVEGIERNESQING